MIACVLLSAGLSQRFGSPKALAPLYGHTVIEHVQETILQTPCEEIIVVLGAHAQSIQPLIFNHKRIRIVYNKDYFLGQTSSVQAGLKDLSHEGMDLMLWPVDCPWLRASTIEEIIGHFKEQQPDALIPTYQSRKGHPPVFHRRLTQEILGIPAHQGLNALLAVHHPQTIEINDPGIVQSFNTPEEFERLK